MNSWLAGERRERNWGVESVGDWRFSCWGGRYMGHTTPSSLNDLRHWVPETGVIARVEGTILSSPSIQRTGHGERLQVLMEI